jgi:hypothetical protein
MTLLILAAEFVGLFGAAHASFFAARMLLGCSLFGSLNLCLAVVALIAAQLN